MLSSIYDRYTNFIKIYNLIKKIFNNNYSQCLVPLRKKNLYAIDNKIFLKKRIGQNSVYGTVFISHINKYKFITKVQLDDSASINELKYLKIIRKYALNTQNFHLPLYMINFKCESYNIFDNRLPPNIVEQYYYSYNSTIAEIANGDLDEYIETTIKEEKKDMD